MNSTPILTIQLLLAVLVFSIITVSCQQQLEKQPPAVAQYQQVAVFLTARDLTARLTPQAPLSLEPLDQPDEHFPTLILDVTKTFQTIEGFGGAFTDASAETFYKLPPDKQQEIIDAYFDPVKGIGYSLCRTTIHTCDFSSSSYTYAPQEDDKELKHFSIEPDLKYRIPFIKKALQATPEGFKIFASPWSPPAWMKTNNDMLHGGKLLREYEPTWARYFVRFVEAYEQAGIPIWGLTVQNEPMAVQTWESCIYTAAEERDFVRDHLGPALEKAGLSRLKLMIWDHNRGIMYQRAKVVLDDPAAAKYVWGIGFHWYVGDHFDNVRLVHEAFPDKQLVFTEGCVGPFRWEQLNDWRWGEDYARSIVNDLNNWAVGWVDWNVLLDETGGPNHVQNFCFAPIIGDTRTGEVHYMNSYYYLGHFSKFIRPGAKRIICSSNWDDLLATAFVNPDGKLVVVVLNLTEKAMDFQLWLDGQVAKSTSPARSIMTLVLS